MIEVFQYLKDSPKEEIMKLISIVPEGRTKTRRDPKEGRFKLEISGSFLTLIQLVSWSCDSLIPFFPQTTRFDQCILKSPIHFYR